VLYDNQYWLKKGKIIETLIIVVIAKYLKQESKRRLTSEVYEEVFEECGRLIWFRNQAQTCVMVSWLLEVRNGDIVEPHFEDIVTAISTITNAGTSNRCHNHQPENSQQG